MKNYPSPPFETLPSKHWVKLQNYRLLVYKYTSGSKKQFVYSTIQE